MRVEDSPTPRAQPFWCPFCGEQDFVPSGEGPTEFYCNSCNRRYQVKFLGLGDVERDYLSVDPEGKL